MKTDLEIQKDVMHELAWEPSLTASQIGVAVNKGVVTLSGTIDSYLKRVTAEHAARRIQGVKAVAMDIEVIYHHGPVKTDSEIAHAMLEKLKWNSAIDEEKIKIKVDDGIVTLYGEIDRELERDIIMNEITGMKGIKKIIDSITIKKMPVPNDIELKIAAAFQRSAIVDAKTIHASVQDDKVVLNGTVRSLAEKKDAEKAAWAAPGVTQIENNLVVDYSSWQR